MNYDLVVDKKIQKPVLRESGKEFAYKVYALDKVPKKFELVDRMICTL